MVNLAIVGATGAVGQEVLKILDERKIELSGLKLLASSRTAGTEVRFRGQTYLVQEAEPSAFDGVDVAIFSAGTGVSRELAPEAVERGTIVIDNSNAFRMDPWVPLVVPEINPEAIVEHQGIIANPNCSTIQMVVALKPIYDYARIKRIWVATYQSVSGTGLEAIAELAQQSAGHVQHEKPECRVYPKPIAFNLLPHIDEFLANGYTREEMKMIAETRKILSDPEIEVEPTAVRVPVFVGHSEAITIETEKPVTADMARNLLSTAPGVTVLDDISKGLYPTPLEVASQDNVYVGRIRQSPHADNRLSLWVVGDNLRKGAALNAVQILEHLRR